MWRRHTDWAHTCRPEAAPAEAPSSTDATWNSCSGSCASPAGSGRLLTMGSVASPSSPCVQQAPEAACATIGWGSCAGHTHPFSIGWRAAVVHLLPMLPAGKLWPGLKLHTSADRAEAIWTWTSLVQACKPTPAGAGWAYLQAVGDFHGRSSEPCRVHRRALRAALHWLRDGQEALLQYALSAKRTCRR